MPDDLDREIAELSARIATAEYELQQFREQIRHQASKDKPIYDDLIQAARMNPAGIADFDGDGRLDIAYVQMPHVLGKLRVWTLRPEGLKEIASVDGTSNHVAGSRHLGLSAIADFDGDGVADLAIPSFDRLWLRFLKFKGGVRELARKALPAPAVSDFLVEYDGGKPGVVVGLEGGRKFRVDP